MTPRLQTRAEDLERAVDEYRQALRRTRYGRIVVAADVFGGRVIEQTVEVSDLTHHDLERMMRERPRPAGKGERP